MDTLEYYDDRGNEFFSSTVDADMSMAWKRFRFFLKRGKILDFGCGSGRDSRYFLSHGFDVDATDGSETMCRLASVYTGLDVMKMRFDELDAEDAYDGIWACASVLHLSKGSFHDVFLRMERALRMNGIIYCSFKYGDFEGWKGNRFFSCFTVMGFSEFLKKHPALEISSIWTSSDVRPGRSEEKWLNVIVKKVLV
ncbi:MAG: class I SAM-dependent methyltransferase [Bullifex sp.]